MAGFNVNLYTFTKKIDSTKQPTGTGTQYLCNILTPADITAPVIEITASADLTAFNYAYISAFHRYYWIEGISFEAGIWVLTLAVDVLATYKTYIGGESLYVLRAASSYNGDITDNFYPIINDIVYDTQTETPFTSPTYATGTIVLNISGSTTTGNTTLYELTPDNYRKLVCALYDAIDGFQLTDVVKSVVKKFGGNPEKLINGAMWFPHRIMPADTPTVQVVIGSWAAVDSLAFPIEGVLLTEPAFADAVQSFTIAAHPQVAKGRYLNLAPYSRYTLYLPGVGMMNLDTTLFEGVNGIYVTRYVDAITGRATYRVITVPTAIGDPSLLVTSAECQWGVPITMGGNNIGANVLTGTLATIGSAAAAIASGGTSAIIGAVAGGIGSAVSAMDGATVGSSIGGNLTAPLMPIRLDTVFFKITGEDITHNGRPLMQVKQLSTLSGYVQVQKGDVPIPGTSSEAQRVKDFLEGGFFYE